MQLNPPIPLNVVGGLKWKGPTGKGMAIGWHKGHLEHHIVWIVVFDDTGQIWEVENPYVRATVNITWGRHGPDA